MKKFFLLLIILVFCQKPSFGENLSVFEFTNEELLKLKVKKIKKLTKYSLGSNEKGNYLKAEANGTAWGTTARSFCFRVDHLSGRWISAIVWSDKASVTGKVYMQRRNKQ